MRESISFVCEPGRLEVQAVLLAASLRLAHPSLALIAAVPRALPAGTSALLDVLGVERVAIANPLASDYPIGNKLAALAAGDADGMRVFLDTDTLCLAPLGLETLRGIPFAAKASDIATFGNLDTWAVLYQRFGLTLPAERVTATVSEVTMPPYFNAGVIATQAARELHEAWVRIARAVDAMNDIHPRRPWLDQIALPLAVARCRLRWRCLGERWNFPAHIKPLDGDVAIVHYHLTEVVAREPRLMARVVAVLKAWPALDTMLRSDALWTPVVQQLDRGVHRQAGGWGTLLRMTRGAAARVCSHSRASTAHDLVISGIPRSGTSYLCSLLSQYDNVAIVNEPVALHDSLRISPEPWSVPILHADLRRRIGCGEAVDNKVDVEGHLTEDTASDDVRRAWRPQLRVGSDDWVLGTKNTLAYMSRLEGILRLMPSARVVLCVRNPLDTLASWKGTFAHLVSGDPTDLRIGGLADPFLPRQLEVGLRAVAAMADAAHRRAAWWRLLAQEVLRFRERVVLVRYEDLAADPAHELIRVLGPLARHAGSPRTTASPSTPRVARRVVLETIDHEAVARQCADVAALLGYDVEDSDAYPV